MKLLFLILPITFADEIIYSYKLNFNFGLQNHVSLNQKEIAILNQTTVLSIYTAVIEKAQKVNEGGVVTCT